MSRLDEIKAAVEAPIRVEGLVLAPCSPDDIGWLLGRVDELTDALRELTAAYERLAKENRVDFHLPLIKAHEVLGEEA